MTLTDPAAFDAAMPDVPLAPQEIQLRLEEADAQEAAKPLPQLDWAKADRQFGVNFNLVPTGTGGTYDINDPIGRITDPEKRLSALLDRYPGLDPSMAVEAMRRGHDLDSVTMGKLWDDSKTASVKAKLEEERQDQPDWADLPPFAQLKGVIRNTFGVAESGVQLVSSGMRDNIGLAGPLPALMSELAPEQVQTSQGNFNYLEQLQHNFDATFLGQRFHELVDGKDLDWGDGFVPSTDTSKPNSGALAIEQANLNLLKYQPKPGEFQVRNTSTGRPAVYVDGSIWKTFDTKEEAEKFASEPMNYTPIGDSFSNGLLGMKFGSEAQQALSGLANIAPNLLLDPTNLLGFGLVTGSVRGGAAVTKGAIAATRAGKPVTLGAKEALAAYRADAAFAKNAAGKGAKAARTVTDTEKAQGYVSGSLDEAQRLQAEAEQLKGEAAQPWMQRGEPTPPPPAGERGQLPPGEQRPALHAGSNDPAAPDDPRIYQDAEGHTVIDGQTVAPGGQAHAVWTQHATNVLEWMHDELGFSAAGRTVNEALEQARAFLFDIEGLGARARARYGNELTAQLDVVKQQLDDLDRLDADTAEYLKTVPGGADEGVPAIEGVLPQKLGPAEPVAAPEQVVAQELPPGPQGRAQMPTEQRKLAEEQKARLEEALARLDDPELMEQWTQQAWESAGGFRERIERLLDDPNKARDYPDVDPKHARERASSGAGPVDDTVPDNLPTTPDRVNQAEEAVQAGQFAERQRNLRDTIAGLEQEAEKHRAAAAAWTHWYAGSYSNMSEAAKKAAAKGLDLDGLTPEQMTDVLLRTEDGQRAFMRDALGIVQSANGDTMLNVNQALQALTGKQANNIFAAIAKFDSVDELHSLTRGHMWGEYIGDLVKAQDADAVKQVFIKMMSAGDVTTPVGRMRTLRQASRLINDGSPANDAVKGWLSVADPGMVIPRTLKWGNEIAARSAPWAYRVKASDITGTLNMWSDMTHFVLERGLRKKPLPEGQVKDFRERVMRQLVEAPDDIARKKVHFAALEEMQLMLLRHQGMPFPEGSIELQAFRNKFRQYVHDGDQQGNPTWNPGEEKIAASNGWDGFYLGGQKMGSGRGAQAENLISEDLWMPDGKIMHRLAKNVNAIKKHGGEGNQAAHVVDVVFDKYWRTMVLAFRPAFTFRNVIDAHVRLLLAGRPSMFTNPLHYASMFAYANANPDSRIGRSLQKFVNTSRRFDVTGDTDILGNDWARLPESVEGEFDTVQQHWAELIASQQSAIDPGWAGVNMTQAGHVIVDRANTHQYWSGVAHNLGRMASDPLVRRILDIEAMERGIGHGKLDPVLQGWIDRTSVRLSDGTVMKPSAREAMIDALLNGPLKEDWDRVSHLLPNRSGVDMHDPAILEEFLFNRRGGKLLTGTDENPFSYYSRLYRYTGGNADDMATGGFNANVVQAMWDGRYNRVSNVTPGGGGATAKRLNAENRARTQRLAEALHAQFGSKDVLDGYRVPQVSAPNWVEGKGRPSAFESATNQFFHFDAWAGKGAYQAPNFKFAYHEFVADNIGMLSPEEAGKVLAREEANLGSSPSMWAQKTLNRMRANVRNTRGESGISAVDLAGWADRHAARDTQSRFYTASKRNQTAYALRLVFPFLQAWANTMKQWGKEAGQAPWRVYTPMKLYQNMTADDTATFRRAIESDPEYDPDRAIFYKDAKSGQMTYDIPFVGNMMKAGIEATTGGASNLGEIRVGSTINSLNLAFQGGPGPGWSPIAQFASQMVSGQDWYDKLPDVLGQKTQIKPYRNLDEPPQNAIDTAAMAFSPTILKGALSLVGMGGTSTSKYVNPIMAAEYSNNPEAYTTPDGTIDQTKLTKNAQATANRLGFFQALFKVMYPGTVTPKPLVHTETGQDVAAETVARQFFLATAEYGGDRGLAWKQISDQYGSQAAMAVLSDRSDPVRPTTDSWRFLQNHRDELSNYGDVVPYLFPADGTFNQAYDAYLRNNFDKNDKKTPAEKVQEANNLLYSGEKSQLNLKLANGQITDEQHTAEITALNTKYMQDRTAEFDPVRRVNDISTIRKALKASPDLVASAPGGKIVAEYLALRDQAIRNAQARGLSVTDVSPDPFTSDKVGDIRRYLKQQGDAAARQDTEAGKAFRVAWKNLFRGEVD